MLTIEKLKNYGADVDEGLMRCMDKEDFYLMLIQAAISDNRLPKLRQQIEEKDLKSAFETAHALKGMYTNLALTPLAAPIVEMTELLRSGTNTDYTALLNEADAQFEMLCSL